LNKHSASDGAHYGRDDLFAIYGVGGCGRSIMPYARDWLKRRGISEKQLVFIDDSNLHDIVNGHRVMTRAAFLAAPAGMRHVGIGIADCAIRAKIAHELDASGLVRGWTIQHENTVIMDDVSIGDGALLSPFVTITSNIRIGRHFHANLYSYVEHDCIVGDFVTLAPGAKVNGNIVLEDRVYIGSGAVIKQGKAGAPLVIGAGAIIGLGAVVTRSVPAGAVYVGNPARPLLKKQS
jgi:sugar O-acyltransferase (sialic acid O-acetyltransferase NeuD family)